MGRDPGGELLLLFILRENAARSNDLRATEGQPLAKETRTNRDEPFHIILVASWGEFVLLLTPSQPVQESVAFRICVPFFADGLKETE
jgi:hypothetical protein